MYEYVEEELVFREDVLTKASRGGRGSLARFIQLSPVKQTHLECCDAGLKPQSRETATSYSFHP
jgi:hypothetical protein